MHRHGKSIYLAISWSVEKLLHLGEALTGLQLQPQLPLNRSVATLTQ